MEKKRVLVVGGSGYLGQHLLEDLLRAEEPFDLAFTYHRTAPADEMMKALSPALAFRVDLVTGQGFDSISDSFGQPNVVINCAALSIPRECEKNPAYAMSVNVPSSLVGWLLSFADKNTFLIHLSTDQVYEGVMSFYKESDETDPVNMYGKTKVASEQFIRANFPNFAILRSSIIYGPESVTPVSKSLPLQWIDSTLSRGHEVEFFYNEFRCPIYVKDVVNIILILIKK
ncbi:NAD(P)-binding Rossmann-fold superfamily protein isoform X2 [Wolffia australiana]